MYTPRTPQPVARSTAVARGIVRSTLLCRSHGRPSLLGFHRGLCSPANPSGRPLATAGILNALQCKVSAVVLFVEFSTSWKMTDSPVTLQERSRNFVRESKGTRTPGFVFDRKAFFIGTSPPSGHAVVVTENRSRGEGVPFGAAYCANAAAEKTATASRIQFDVFRSLVLS